jgi:hypothetical protein
MDRKYFGIIATIIGLALGLIIKKSYYFLRNQPWLFKKQIHHDIFGRMWFVKDKNPIYNHYQSHIYFKPANKEIDIFFDSDVEFDSNQTLFFNAIEKQYQIIFFECLKLIEDQFKFKFSSDTDLNLWAIEIGKFSELNQKWSLSYSSEKHSLHNISVDLIDWKIQKIQNNVC